MWLTEEVQSRHTAQYSSPFYDRKLFHSGLGNLTLYSINIFLWVEWLSTDHGWRPGTATGVNISWQSAHIAYMCVSESRHKSNGHAMCASHWWLMLRRPGSSQMSPLSACFSAGAAGGCEWTLTLTTNEPLNVSVFPWTQLGLTFIWFMVDILAHVAAPSNTILIHHTYHC